MLLLILFILGLIITVFWGIAISYHLKRFGIPADKTSQKILIIFWIGAAILISLNLILLLFNFIKK